MNLYELRGRHAALCAVLRALRRTFPAPASMPAATRVQASIAELEGELSQLEIKLSCARSNFVCCTSGSTGGGQKKGLPKKP